MLQVSAFDLQDRELREAYDRFFESCPGAFIQQSTWWAEAIAPIGPDEAIFLLAHDGGRIVAGLPLYLFRGPAGPVMTSVPQAGPMGGIFTCRGLSEPQREEIYASLIAAAEEAARRAECLTLSLITNPFAPDVDVYRRHFRPDLQFENFTQVAPVAKAVRGGDFILPNNKERNPGRTIRKAREAGLTTKMCRTDGEFGQWYRAHVKRHGELGAQPLSEALLRRLMSVLEPRGKAFLLLAMAGDIVASGCLFVLHREICDAFMLSMDSQFASKAPNYLVTERALIECAARGVLHFNWQSAASRAGGVYSFKKQWGSEELPYFFLTRVYAERNALLRIGKESVIGGYPGHFVVPYGFFDAPDVREFRKG